MASGLEYRSGRQATFHDGAINGFVSCLWYLPEYRLTVAAVTDNGPPSGDRFCNRVAGLLTAERLAGF